jgi:hypothetical protein
MSRKTNPITPEPAIIEIPIPPTHPPIPPIDPGDPTEPTDPSKPPIPGMPIIVPGKCPGISGVEKSLIKIPCLI